MILPALMTFIFAGTMLTAAQRDASTMTIPNWISVVVLLSFFMITPFVWQGWDVFGQHMIVGSSVFALGFIMFAMGWFGGGDAKLMAATAFWWTLPDLALYAVYTTLAGGILGLFILVGRKFMPAQVMTSPWIHRMMRDETKMPYGLALAFGALATLPQSDIFRAAAGLG